MRKDTPEATPFFNETPSKHLRFNIESETSPFEDNLQNLQNEKKEKNFVFNLNNNEKNIQLSNKKNNGAISDFTNRSQKIQEMVDLDSEIKNSQSYLFNSKKFFKKNKDSTKINDSDIILKNEELKEEFLNENNLILESSKESKYFQNKHNTNNNESFNNKIESTLETRRMIVELIK